MNGATDFEGLFEEDGGGTAVSTPKKIIDTPPEIETEVVSLKTSTRALAVRNDTELTEAESIRDRANRVAASIKALYKDEKAERFNRHRAITAEENFMLGAATEVLAACDRVMKPYLRERELARERERKRLEAEAQREAEEKRRQEAEAARKEAKERADLAKKEADERAAKEREAADVLARQIEDEALARAAQLERDGKGAEAAAVVADAEMRRDNVLEEATEVAAQVTAQASEEAKRTIAEGTAIAREIESAPVQRMHVAAPPPASSVLKSSSTSKTYKSNREKAVSPTNKLKMLRYIISEAERGNFSPLSWVDHNFKQIDASARQSQELFPTEDISGLDVGLDVGLRSKRTPRPEGPEEGT